MKRCNAGSRGRADDEATQARLFFVKVQAEPLPLSSLVGSEAQGGGKSKAD